MDVSKFPARLRALREKRYHNRKDFGDAYRQKFGVSTKIENSLKQYEYGKSLPTIDTFSDLCNILECDSGYLLGEYDDCTTQDNQFIHKTTGLSDEAIQRLKGFNSDEGFGRYFIELLNWLLLDPRFTYELSSSIIKYCDKYLAYQQGAKELKANGFLISKLSKDDIKVEIDLRKNGILTTTITDRELSNLSDLKDISHLQVQRALDNVLDCITFHYCQKNGCDIDGPYREK